MKNFLVVFKLYEGNITKLQCYQEITGYFVFYLKLVENFQHKAMHCVDVQKIRMHRPILSTVQWFQVIKYT